MLVTAALGAALLSKEQALAAIPLFLLLETGWIDSVSNLRTALLEGVRNHRRLWILLIAAGCASAVFVWIILSQSQSAGFGVPGRPPAAYFLTECRVILQYIRLFLFPVGQNMDPHPPLSYSLSEHGAVFCLGILAVSIWICFRFRRRAPLATFGFLAFLIFLAPTSSFIPLYDPMAEHRMYLPLMGLCLIVVDLLSRIQITQPRVVAAMTCALVLYAGLAFDRSRVWSNATMLAEDAAARPPLTTRSVRLLAQAYLSENRPQDFLDRVSANPPPGLDHDADMLTEVGLVLACVGRNEDAVDRLQKAVAIHPDPFGFGLKGYLEAKLGRTLASLQDLNRAIELGPDFDAAYGYRGLWYLASNQFESAREDFRRALALNPLNALAREGLEEAERHIGERADRSGQGK